MISGEDIEAFRSMNTHYIFDVDGTLTPSRGLMDPDFQSYMLELCERENIYLATGSDSDKTIEQIGQELYNKVIRVYNCSGNSVWEKGTNVYNNDWKLEQEPWKWLETILIHHNFQPKTGWHFDERPGLVNYSIVGRNAKPHQRKLYVEYDTKSKDRLKLAEQFNTLFGDTYNVVAQVAGETGLDIMPVGKGKQQILEDFSNDDIVVFFGDKIHYGGNDYDIAEGVRKRPEGKVYGVNSWEDTMNLLEKHVYSRSNKK